MEYLTVDDIRDEFGSDVQAMTDAAILRRLDRLSGYMEDALGHSFGRAAIVQSTDGTHTVQVTATSLVVGGDTYLFATYGTLQALADAVNSAGKAYGMALLPTVLPATPSTLLKLKAATACGPTYGSRQVLDVSAWQLVVSGDGKSHLFLPLPLNSVTSVTENGTAVEATAYWALQGESWLIRKLCGCNGSSCCAHPHGHWSGRYPGNLIVRYVPLWWNTAPGPVVNALVEAFSSQSGYGPMESESFGDYSYRRGVAKAETWQDILSGQALRQYVVRLHL